MCGPARRTQVPLLGDSSAAGGLPGSTSLPSFITRDLAFVVKFCEVGPARTLALRRTSSLCCCLGFHCGWILAAGGSTSAPRTYLPMRFAPDPIRATLPGMRPLPPFSLSLSSPTSMPAHCAHVDIRRRPAAAAGPRAVPLHLRPRAGQGRHRAGATGGRAQAHRG